MLIITNTIVLAFDRYPADKNIIEMHQKLNEIFTYLFIAEMLMKLLGMGFKEYARDRFNLFDAFIVVMSIIDIILQLAIDNA